MAALYDSRGCTGHRGPLCPPESELESCRSFGALCFLSFSCLISVSVSRFGGCHCCPAGTRGRGGFSWVWQRAGFWDRGVPSPSAQLGCGVGVEKAAKWDLTPGSFNPCLYMARTGGTSGSEMQSLGQGIEVLGPQGVSLSPNPSWAGGFPCKAWVAPEPVYPPQGARTATFHPQTQPCLSGTAKATSCLVQLLAALQVCPGLGIAGYSSWGKARGEEWEMLDLSWVVLNSPITAA